MIKSMVETMVEISKTEMLPRYYQEDLSRDFEIAAKYNGRDVEYIWMLREAGSLLFPLRIGANPTYIENYIRSDSTAIYYFVTTEGDFQKITKSEAKLLCWEEPINFRSIKSTKELERKIHHLLNDPNVTDGPFDSPAISDHSRLAWDNWYHWFLNVNQVMANVMRSAIANYDDLNLRERRKLQSDRLQPIL